MCIVDGETILDGNAGYRWCNANFTPSIGGRYVIKLIRDRIYNDFKPYMMAGNELNDLDNLGHITSHV